MKRKFLHFWGIVLSQDDGEQVGTRRYQTAKPRFERVEDNAFHQKNCVVDWRHDPRHRVAGDVSYQRNDCPNSGSIEQF
jgi:hypothetical protein